MLHGFLCIFVALLLLPASILYILFVLLCVSTFSSSPVSCCFFLIGFLWVHGANPSSRTAFPFIPSPEGTAFSTILILPFCVKVKTQRWDGGREVVWAEAAQSTPVFFKAVRLKDEWALRVKAWVGWVGCTWVYRSVNVWVWVRSMRRFH